MSEFEVSMLIQNNVQSLYLMKERVWTSPPYQRVSDIWPLDKKQLLIDSILNGFDLPKMYFHRLTSAHSHDGKAKSYAIIDGKQRLSAIWGFIDGDFALADDFTYLFDDQINASGLTYGGLSEKYPHLRASFDAAQLSVAIVRTDDLELIEDMFSRLNEAVPLNAPEKRNAFGGPLPPVIRSLAQHRFFTDRVPFEDRRYKHRDLATKLLWIEHSDKIVDTKKVYLDNFVKKWASDKKTAIEASELSAKVDAVLDQMANTFISKDPLLRSIGMAMVMYHLFRLLSERNVTKQVCRDWFTAFEEARSENKKAAEADISAADYSLLEFEKYVQSPNDAYATRLRLAVMVRFLKENFNFDEISQEDKYFSTVL